MLTATATEQEAPPAMLNRTVSQVKDAYGSAMISMAAGDLILAHWAQRSGEPVAFLMVGPEHVAACLEAMGIDPATVPGA